MMFINDHNQKNIYMYILIYIYFSEDFRKALITTKLKHANVDI